VSRSGGLRAVAEVRVGERAVGIASGASVHSASVIGPLSPTLRRYDVYVYVYVCMYSCMYVYILYIIYII
jgi:hypothetical protein